MRRLILTQHQSPGDVVCVTAAVKALHGSCPGQFQTDYRGNCRELFENNPYITPLTEREAQTLPLNYSYAIQNCGRPRHFVEAFTEYLADVLGVHLTQLDFRGDIYLSRAERDGSILPGRMGRTPYWLIDAGCKRDYTNKQWSYSRFQEVVDALAGQVVFVQIGSLEHMHPELKGVVNLIGKTTIRQLISLVHRSDGVLTPVSFPMHLAAAVPLREGLVGARPCVVIAGQREPRHWEQYPGHTYLGATGKLPCVELGKGCWKSRVKPLGDGDEKDNSLCLEPRLNPVGAFSEQYIPLCMNNVSVDDVVNSVLNQI